MQSDNQDARAARFLKSDRKMCDDFHFRVMTKLRDLFRYAVSTTNESLDFTGQQL